MTNKMNLQSKNILAEKIDQIKQLFPEVITEGNIDFERLKTALGDAIDSGRERYGLSWAGKSECFANIQTPSIGTLKPCTEESVNFEETENLIIEGDNLEVLKLLQRSYYGKIKMIYIDPPYNTGNEFIYPDNFREGLQDYLRYSGQVDENGLKLSANTETGGRFHSKWLNMMYPRLFLARNLLGEDGIIFVSIDDHEVYNLRALMNETFGEECFIGAFVWKRRQNVDSRAKNSVSQDHEYILCYGRNKDSRLRGQDKDLNKYSNPDNDLRGPWMSDNMVGLATKEQRPNLHYDLTDPNTGIIYPCPPTGWRYEPKRMESLIKAGEILFPKSGEGRPRRKKFLKDLESEFTGFSTILDAAFNTQGTREVRDIFDGAELFDFPKPVDLIKRLIQQGTNENDKSIVIDFFAGSGTTAQAVLELNQENGGNRRFILVQLPEPTNNSLYPTIAQIAKERIRRIINKLDDKDSNKEPELFENQKEKQDHGFKVFNLAASNFKIWEQDKVPTKAEDLAKQLELYIDHVKSDSSQEDILYELLLKSGYDLNAKVEKLNVAGQNLYSIENGLMVICLEKSVNKSLIDEIVKLKPNRAIFLDIAFHGNDQLKTNTVLDMKSKDIEFRTV